MTDQVKEQAREANPAAKVVESGDDKGTRGLLDLIDRNSPLDNRNENRSLESTSTGKRPETKEAYSTVISHLAFDALKREVMQKDGQGGWKPGKGVDLIGSEKWRPVGKEQENWVSSIERHARNPIKLPSQVEVKVAASIGSPAYVNEKLGSKLADSGRQDSLYFGASLGIAIEFKDAKGSKISIVGKDGEPVNDPATGKPKEFDATVKTGNVFRISGVGNVYEINRDGDLRTFAIPLRDVDKIPGFEVEGFAQKMVDMALAPGTNVREGVQVKFPNYDKSVDTNMDGLLGASTKPGKGVPDLFIAQAKLTVRHTGSPEGMVSYERQVYEARSRSAVPRGPESINGEFILVQANAEGKVFMTAKIGVADMKTPPKVADLKKELKIGE